jgi:hypothetical protein
MTTEAGGIVPQELLDRLANVPGKPYDWADEVLDAIAAAGYELVPAEWFAQQQRALRGVEMTGPVWVLGEGRD